MIRLSVRPLVACMGAIIEAVAPMPAVAADQPMLVAQSQLYRNIVFSPDGTLMVGADERSAMLSVFETATGKLLRQWKAADEDSLTWVCFDTDSSQVISYDRSKVSYWSTATGALIESRDAFYNVAGCIPGIGPVQQSTQDATERYSRMRDGVTLFDLDEVVSVRPLNTATGQGLYAIGHNFATEPSSTTVWLVPLPLKGPPAPPVMLDLVYDAAGPNAIAVDMDHQRVFHLGDSAQHDILSVKMNFPVRLYDLQNKRDRPLPWLQGLKASALALVNQNRWLLSWIDDQSWRLHDVASGAVVKEGKGAIQGVDPHHGRFLVADKDRSYLVSVPDLVETTLVGRQIAPVFSVASVGQGLLLNANGITRRFWFTGVPDDQPLSKSGSIALSGPGTGIAAFLAEGDGGQVTVNLSFPDRQVRPVTLPQPYVPTDIATFLPTGELLVLALAQEDLESYSGAQQRDTKEGFASLATGLRFRTDMLLQTYAYRLFLISPQGAVRRLADRHSVPIRIAFNAQRKQLVMLGQGALEVLRWPDLKRLKYLSTSPFFVSMELSADGMHALLQNNTVAQLLDLETGNVQVEYPSSNIQAAVFGSDSVLYLAENNQLKAWHYRGERPEVFKVPNSGIHASNDLRHWVVRTQKGRVLQVNPRKQVELDEACLKPLRWSADGRLLICKVERVENERHDRYQVIDAEQGKPVGDSFQHTAMDDILQFSMDGTSLYFVQRLYEKKAGEFITRGASWLSRKDLRTGEIEKLWTPVEENRQLRLLGQSADGRHLVVVTGDIATAWDAPTEDFKGTVLTFQQGNWQVVRSLGWHAEMAYGVALGPDARQVAIAEGPRLRLIDGDLAPRVVEVDAWRVGFTKEDTLLVIARANTIAHLVAFGSGELLRDWSAPAQGKLELAGTRLIRYYPEEHAELIDPLQSHQTVTTLGNMDQAFSELHLLQNDWLLGLREDRTLEFWHPSKTGWQARLAMSVDGNWLAVGSDGRFDGSDLDRLDAFHWVLPDQPYQPVDTEVLMLNYYEPNLITRLLAGQTFPRLPALGTLDMRQPALTIGDLQPSADGKSVALSVSVQAKPGQQVRDLKVFRDGRLWREFPQGGGELALSTEGRARVRVEGVALSSLEPRVQLSAYAFNGDGVKSKTVALDVAASPVTAAPRIYLIGIGINAYESPDWTLKYAVNDATSVLSSLQAGLASSQVVSVQMTAPQQAIQGAIAVAPSKENIKAVLQRLATGDSNLEAQGAEGLRAMQPDDQLIISFSGHAFANQQGLFHLMPMDIGSSQPRAITQALEQVSISSDELAAWLQPLQGHITLIVDACYAASIVGEEFRAGPLNSKGLGQLAFDKGMRVLAASQADSVALESGNLQHGYLTYSLVQEGLIKGAADFRPKDGHISLEEWLNFGQQRVPQLVAQMSAEAAAGDDLPVQRPVFYNFDKHVRELSIGAVSGRPVSAGTP